MNIKDIRRDNLKAWFSDKSIPEREKSYISQLINGKAAFGERTARRLERDYEMGEGYLDSCTFNNTLSVAEEASEYIVKSKQRNSVFNVLDAFGAGILPSNADPQETITSLVMPAKKAKELIGSANHSGKIKLIMAVKDSMTPTIQPNDLLFVDTSINEYVGEAVYILYHGNELVCKRLSLVGKNLIVSSDNEFYQAWNWADRPEATKIVGKVLRALPLNFKVFGN